MSESTALDNKVLLKCVQDITKALLHANVNVAQVCTLRDNIMYITRLWTESSSKSFTPVL